MDAAFLTDLLECSVCLEQLDTSSKVLPCQHTFCKQCLQEIVTSHKELRCPECRTLVDCNIDELPCNILLIRLLEGIKHSSRLQQTPSKGPPGEKEAEDGKAVTSPSIPPAMTGSPRGQVQPLPVAQTAVAQHDRSKLVSKQIGFALPCAKALYTYEAKEPGDLAFKKGDVILLKKRLDQNWFQGELNGQSGFLPASYVQVLAPMAHVVPQCKALFDFAISSNDQQDCLTFNKGDIITVIRRIDENWAEGKMTDKIGIFPVSFVQMNAAAKTIMKLSANTFSGPSRVAPPTPTSDEVQSSEETTTSASGNPPSGVGSSEPLSSVAGPSAALPTSSSCSSPPVITTMAVPLSTPLSTPSHSVPISHPRSSCSQQHKDKRHSMAVLTNTGQPQPQQSPQATSHRHSLEIVSSESPVGDCHELSAQSLSSLTTTVTTAISQFSTTLIPTLVTAKGPESCASKCHRRVCSRKENCYSAVCIKPKETSAIPTPATSAAVPAAAGMTALSTSNIPQTAALVSHQASNNVYYVALYNYKPQKEDELLLRKGDLYTVSEKCQDGWFKGTSLLSGKSGVFPGNYVHLSNKPAALPGQTSLTPTTLSTVRSVQSGKVTPPGTGSVSSVIPSGGHHHHHHHHHHHTRHKSFSSLAVSVDLPSVLPSSSSAGEGTNGFSTKSTPSESNSQEWAQAVPSELSSVSSSHEWTAVVSPVFLQPQQQAKVLTSSSPQVANPSSTALGTATATSGPTANPATSASPIPKAVMPSYGKGPKTSEGNPWCRSWQPQGAQDTPACSPFQSATSSIVTNGNNPRVDFVQAAQSTAGIAMAASYPAVSAVSSPAGSASGASDTGSGSSSSTVINQSWHGSSLYSSLALSTASAITPPNVTLESADGQAVPFARNEKKKDKERVSLMKRLTSKCKSRSPPPVSNYSCDNSAFVDTPLNPSCIQPKVTPFVHIRSGSCPNEAFAGQNVNHKKSSSLDGSSNEPVPKSVYRTKQPQPLVRERFRCIVPYPPNSELELELKVGDVVYVHRKREDGWYKGTLQRTGKTGLFPASFVESY